MLSDEILLTINEENESLGSHLKTRLILACKT